jgi:cobalt-zinc-cadmium efflux system membrane fusion protein
MKLVAGRVTLPAVAAAAVLVFSAGCSREQHVDAKSADAAAKVEEIADPNIFQVDHPERFPLVKVESRATVDELKVNGVVAPDVNRTVPVNALSMGRVIEIHAKLGDDVKKGQVLLTLHSPDVSLAFANYHKALADELLARRSLERAQALLEHGAVAQKDLQQAEDNEEKAKVDVKTVAEQIRILGGDLDRPSPIVEIRAPASGTIVEQNTTAGAGVKSLDNAPNLFTIADLSHLWVLCDVYENNLAQVHPGELGRVQLNAYLQRPLRGRISNISKVLDPATRTAKVRLEMDNPAGMLRPGMFAAVTFISPDARRRAVVPAAAILRLHDKDWVFKPDGPKRFRRVEVQSGAMLPYKFQEIAAGVAAGDEVVANALQLNSTVEQQ